MALKTYPKAYFELLTAAFTLIMGMSLSSAFLPIFAYKLDPSGILVGSVSSAWFISRIFTELPSGILADRLGRWKLLVSGLALSAAGAFLCSTADSIHILIVGRALWGLGTGLFFISSSVTIFDLFKSNVRGRALGTFQAIQFVGSLIGAPIGSFMVAFTGFKGVFVMASTLMICSCIVTLFSKGLRRTAMERNVRQTTLSLTDVLSSLKSRGLAALCANSFFRMFVIMGLSGTVFPLYLNFELGIPVELIGLIVSFKTFGTIIATALSGYLSDKFGRKPMIALGMLLDSLCFYAYTVASSFDTLVLIGLAEGFGSGMILTSMMVLLSEVVSSKLRGGALGMYRTFMDVGGFIGPLFFMSILEPLGYQLTFISAVIILAANIVLILTVKKKNLEVDETG